MRDQADGPERGAVVRAYFHGLPAVPAATPDEVSPASGQVVTGPIPHEPPNFQVPPQVAVLASMTGEACVVCVVTGQRGVGKTQAVAAYARQRVRDGWLVAWIGAENGDQLNAGVADLAGRLGLRHDEDSADVTATKVRDHLQTRSTPSLLVFDNVVSMDAIRPHVPSVGPVQVVVTSTVRGSQLGREVPVDVFDEPTALRFLREATGLDDDAGAAELAAELGHLPLALGQAAARIRAGWDYPTYLANFRKFSAEKHLSRRDGDPYPLGAATAVLIALEPFRDGVAALLSVLSPDGVWRELLNAAAEDELAQLYEASLVEFAGTNLVIMHRLVQRVIRDRLKAAGTYGDVLASALLGLGHAAQSTDNREWTGRHYGAEVARQIDALWGNTTEPYLSDLAEGLLLLRVWSVNFLKAIARVSAAEGLGATVYRDCLTRFGPVHPITVSARRTLLRGSADQSADLTEMLEQDFATAQEEFGRGDLKTLSFATSLAARYRAVDRAGDGVKVLDQALEPWLTTPSDQPDVLSAIDTLARAHVDSGRPEKAVTLLTQQLVHNQKKLLGQNIRVVLDMMATLATAHSALGQHANSTAARRFVVNETRRVVGDEHPLYIAALCSLGIGLMQARSHREARAPLDEALTLATRLFGPDHEFAVLAARALGLAKPSRRFRLPWRRG